jgi:hypothetical protein
MSKQQHILIENLFRYEISHRLLSKGAHLEVALRTSVSGSLDFFTDQGPRIRILTTDTDSIRT